MKAHGMGADGHCCQVSLRTVRTLVAALLSCLVSPLTAAQGLDALLAKIAQAYGGEEAGDFRAMLQSGVTHAVLRDKEGHFVCAIRRPDRLRFEVTYATGPEVRILRGAESWLSGRPMSLGSHSAMILQAARLSLPWILFRGRKQLRELGTVQAPDGMTLRALELPLAPGQVLTVEIDPATGRILHSRGTLVGSRGTMEFDTIYQDFESREGRLYAATEIHFAKGIYTGYTKIDKVEFPDNLPDSLFEPDPAPRVQPSDDDLRL